MTDGVSFTFHPATAERWSDIERLFGPRGACGGCWCMWWRKKRSNFERDKGEGNKAAFHEIVAAGEEPGVIAYADGIPAGWCAIAPRDDYPALERSRVLKRIDDQPVWSITCLFVARAHRRQGLSVRLLGEAVAYAGSRGATTVEGYPVEPRSGAMPDVFAWTGTVSAFLQAGFVEAARGSETRPIMRFSV